ncbi:uncharacterized protein LOC110457695 [Mizuhopecten yessoensis]|uniref:Uncharacterized protein n=1 Tax=Mizuhopecten yessoensis TaxID=6573 RepID=A0A210Q8B6_MIZYE|nr:uncharacterized protein LOC110457695 [Mizuhopecten yessoensis]OWF44929.1 hypothetical protein KP79_PYT16507 [Mizuhopecten yessoensis]
MLSSTRITFPVSWFNVARIIATILVCQSSLQLIQATHHHHQSETETPSSVKSFGRLDQLTIQNFDKSLHHEDSEVQDRFSPISLVRKKKTHISRQEDVVNPNIPDRTYRYFSNQHHYFTIKTIGSEDGTTIVDTWKGNCPNFMPVMIKPFNISTPIFGSREKIIKVVLRKRKERTNKNVCIKNTCCIFPNVVSMQLLIAWFVKGYEFFSSDNLCCKISVLCLDEGLATHIIGHDLDVYIKAVDKIKSEGELGHITLNLYNLHEKVDNDFNYSSMRNNSSMRNRRDISSFNSSRDFNTTKTFHQISIQNNVDASWGMVCVFSVVMLVIVVGCGFKMFDMKQNTKVHFSYHDGIHLMYVNDLIRRKARLLPMFRSAWRQNDEEILFQRGRKDPVPLASVVEEDEEVQIENYNEDEQYLDL